jgi:hypothetical protein
MKWSNFWIVLISLVFAPVALTQELNVLVIGSTHSFSEEEIGQSGVVHEKPFDPTAIATHLQGILSQDELITDVTPTVNVVFDDIYKAKDVVTAVGGGGFLQTKDYRCYSLMQYFMWPDGKAARMTNLRGEGTYQWDYIVVCEDAYVMAHFPGMFAEAVKMIQDEVSKSAHPAGIVLLAQWPENSSSFSATDFNEIVYRIGDSAGLPVVPAGKAWESYTDQDSDNAHPTPRGGYLAAAALYSRLYNRSAKTSGYNYPAVGDAIADHALSVVQANDGVAQYSGLYTTANAFQMKYVRERQVDWNEYGTSTEEGFAAGLMTAYADARVNHIRRTPPASGDPVDLSYSRGSDAFETEKQYQVDPARFGRVHGFPMGDHGDTGEVTMIYGIDKRYETSGAFENGTDLGVAYSMVREDEVPLDVRGIPVRLMWSKIDHFQPTIPGYGDDWHLSTDLNQAVGAYMYTLLSGRCPVEEEPPVVNSTDWNRWFCRKVGYETAWQMAHLTTRAPGFRVVPSTATRTTVTTATPEIMSVRFLNPPESDVTVTVSVSNTDAATVSPATLTFTPANYATAQEVTVTGKEFANPSENFDVNFATSSNDFSYDGLSDSWNYDALQGGSDVDLIAGFDGNNTSTIEGSTKTLSNAHHGPDAVAAGVSATLWTTDSMAKEFQWSAAGQTSLGKWGTLTLIPSPVTLNVTNVATINAPTTLNFTIDNSAGTASLDIQTFHFSAQRDAGAALEVTIAYAGGDLAGSSAVQTLINDTGTNHGYDVDLTAILTDRVLAPGETATFTISQTTSETARLRLDDIGISGEVLTAGPDTTAPNPDPMTWVSEPTAVNSSSITMTATTASDPSGVEYYFAETSGNPGGSDSGWQDSPAYTDTGLQADTQYTYTVTARDKAATPNSTAASAAASATTSPASSPVSAGNSTVVASPTSVPADDTTTSTITVTLKDAGGAAVSGKTVSLVGNGSATIQTANNTSDTNGVVTFTVQSGTVGTETFTATGDSVTITQTAVVEFTTVPTPGVAGLLAGFDGTQTQNTIAPAGITSNSGVRELAGPRQDAEMAGSVSARIWTDQTTNKELQWSSTSQSTTTGNWGLTDLATDASTANDRWVVTQQNASWINFEITNTGTTDVTLDKFHVSANRIGTGAPTTLTISLEQNGTFANPPVLSASDLTASGTQDITLIAGTGWSHYEFAFAGMLTDSTLAAGETATFRITNNAGTARLYLDNIGISGSIGTVPGNNFESWISGFTGLGGQTALTDDPDGDGDTNAEENFFGTHPGERSQSLAAGAVNLSGGTTFTFTHPVNESPASDLTATYIWSKDLTTFYTDGNPDPAGTTVTFAPGTPADGRVTVTATITGTAADRIFVSVDVTQD